MDHYVYNCKRKIACMRERDAKPYLSDADATHSEHGKTKANMEF